MYSINLFSTWFDELGQHVTCMQLLQRCSMIERSSFQLISYVYIVKVHTKNVIKIVIVVSHAVCFELFWLYTTCMSSTYILKLLSRYRPYNSVSACMCWPKVQIQNMPSQWLCWFAIAIDVHVPHTCFLLACMAIHCNNTTVLLLYVMCTYIINPRACTIIIILNSSAWAHCHMYALLHSRVIANLLNMWMCTTYAF